MMKNCPHGYDHKLGQRACPECEKPCRFICLECGVPLLGAFERDGHGALTGHHSFGDRGHLN